ncbi:hypothetical protein [Tenacibaculum sp. 190130A14a]
MKNVVIAVLFFCILVSCKGSSDKEISKHSKDTSIYYKNLFKIGLIKDSIASVSFDLGSEYSAKGEYKKAKRFYQKSNEIEPNNKYILSALGILSADLKEEKDCIMYFDKSIEVDSLDGTTYMNYGAAFNRLNNFDKSIKVLDKGLKLENDLERKGYFYYNLANAYYKKKDYKKSNELNNLALDIVKLPAVREDIIELKKVLKELNQ